MKDNGHKGGDLPTTNRWFQEGTEPTVQTRALWPLSLNRGGHSTDAATPTRAGGGLCARAGGEGSAGHRRWGWGWPEAPVHPCLGGWTIVSTWLLWIQVCASMCASWCARTQLHACFMCAHMCAPEGVCLVCACASMHTSLCPHACAPTRFIQTHTVICAHTSTRLRSCACTHTHPNTCFVYLCMHAHTHVCFVCLHAHTWSGMCTRVRVCTHVRSVCAFTVASDTLWCPLLSAGVGSG